MVLDTRGLAGLLAFLLLASVPGPARCQESHHLFVWAADADGNDSDFVAVLDARRASESYGRVLTTLPVGMPAVAHHTEHRMPADGRLFVNGFRSGTSFVVDLRDPAQPSLVARFTSVPGFSYPHSFERLPNGNVLATFQNAEGGVGTGGLVELDPQGQPVRSSSAADPAHPEIRPYSLAVLPRLDLVVSTTADMRVSPLEDPSPLPDTIQLWRLSDLSLQATRSLPPGPRGDEHRSPAEPRLMPDGETLLVSTFRCGLYRIGAPGAEEPRPELVHSFAFRNPEGDARHCALPVVVDRYWIQTVPARNALVAVDLGDPSHAREVSAVDLGAGRWPHWIAVEPSGTRIVVTGYLDMRSRVMMLTFDAATGRLAIDRAFGDEGLSSFADVAWPHGDTGPAVPHGAVFSGR